MTAGQSRLPADFEALEALVDDWAIAGAQARMQRRLDSTEAERLEFYAAAKDLLSPALKHLDGRGLANLDAADKRLLDLMLTLGHVALAVEHLGDQEAEHAVSHRHFRITRSTEDWRKAPSA